MTNPTRFLIPAQWPATFAHDFSSNHNHQHIFHRFETCTCSWTKSSQQQWQPPNAPPPGRPYWWINGINYHDPLGRPCFLGGWHWVGGPLKGCQLGRSAFCPSSGNAHQSGLSHSTAPVLHRYLGSKSRNKLWNQTCFGLRVWYVFVHVVLFFYIDIWSTTLHAKITRSLKKSWKTRKLETWQDLFGKPARFQHVWKNTSGNFTSKLGQCLKIRDPTTIPLVNGNVYTYIYIYTCTHLLYTYHVYI